MLPFRSVGRSGISAGPLLGPPRDRRLGPSIGQETRLLLRPALPTRSFTLEAMDGAWLHRMRWRRRGAWLWPTFAALTVADAVIGHLLPPAGDSQTLVGAGLLALVPEPDRGDPPVAAVRRAAAPHPRRPAVDRRARLRGHGRGGGDRGRTPGRRSRPPSLADRRRNTMQDAITRAQAYIGDRAPAEFRRNVQYVDTFAIQPGSIYRTCVPNDTPPPDVLRDREDQPPVQPVGQFRRAMSPMR